MERGNVWGGGGWQLGVGDQLAAERGESQCGAVAPAGVEGLLGVLVGDEAGEQSPGGTRVHLEVGGELRSGEVLEGLRLESLQRAARVVGVHRLSRCAGRHRRTAPGSAVCV